MELPAAYVYNVVFFIKLRLYTLWRDTLTGDDGEWKSMNYTCISTHFCSFQLNYSTRLMGYQRSVTILGCDYRTTCVLAPTELMCTIMAVVSQLYCMSESLILCYFIFA